MVLGQSSATAAVLAIENNSTLQALDYEQIKQRLLADNQVLDFETPEPKEAAKFTAAELGGIVVDDKEAELTGFGSHASTLSGFVGDGYRHDENDRKGKQTATFSAELPESGKYRVAIAYIQNGNRATNIPVTVKHASGTETITLNQRQKPEEKELLQPIGVFTFNKDQKASVTISNEGTNGYVIIDAVQFLPQAE